MTISTNLSTRPTPGVMVRRKDFMDKAWFRLYNEFATDTKTQKLSEIYQRRFVMLMCLENSDELYKMSDEDISFALRVTCDEWSVTRRHMASLSFISEYKDGHIFVTNFKNRQFKSDSSADRMRRLRERKKDRHIPVMGDVTVTRSEPEPEPEPEIIPYAEIKNLWNKYATPEKQIQQITSKRKDQIKVRWQEWKTLEAVENIFIKMFKSDFTKNWKNGDFDWLLKNDTNWIKVNENKFLREEVQPESKDEKRWREKGLIP